jgi:hypothetical protein
MAYIDEQPRYTSLIDLIDGGGAGRSGERFEGGGLLSILANALTRPYGYEDRLRDRKNDTTDAITDVISELTNRDGIERLQNRRGFVPGEQVEPNPMQDYPNMSMQLMEGVTVPFTNPYEVGGGFDMTAPSAYPQADVASPMNTAMVSPQQNALEELAANLVADEMGEGFFMLPSEDRRRLIQNKYNELAISLDM